MRAKASSVALIAVLLTLTAFAISANTIPPLTTTMAERMNVNYRSFGYIGMLQYICFALACLVGGKAVERFGLSCRSLVIGGVFCTGVMLALGAMLPGMGWLAAWILPLGFAGGLTESFGSVMVSKFGKSDSSKLLSLSQVFYCLGAIGAPFLVGLLLGQSISWRLAFVIFGALVTGIGIVFTVFTRNLPFDGNEPSAEPTADPAANGPKSLLRDTLFCLVASGLFLYVAIESSVVFWVCAYFEKHLGVAPASAAWRLSLFWGGIAVGRALVLALPRRWTLWPAAICATIGMALGIALLALPWPASVATVLAFFTGFLAGPVWPVIVSISQHTKRSARFTSAVIGVAALGAGAGPWLSSRVIEYLDWPWFFPILAVACLAMVALIVAAMKQATRQPN